MTEYWFARKFPIGSARSGLAPVHWKGWLVMLGFIAGLGAGALVATWLGSTRGVVEGVAVFIVLLFIATIFFKSIARERGDRIRTVADYRKDKQGV